MILKTGDGKNIGQMHNSFVSKKDNNNGNGIILYQLSGIKFVNKKIPD